MLTAIAIQYFSGYSVLDLGSSTKFKRRLHELYKLGFPLCSLLLTVSTPLGEFTREDISILTVADFE